MGRKASRHETLLSDFSMTPYGVQMGASAAAGAASEENSHLLSNRPTGRFGVRGRVQSAHSKYGALPTKSLRSSGIGAVSPMPKRLEVAQHNECAMPISPIRATAAEALEQSQFQMNMNMNMNSTLNLSHLKQGQAQSHGQAHGHGQAVQRESQVTIIGFPPSEAAFIHRKFGSYGTVVNSEWSDNALFVEYEGAQSALRALAENAKWISNGNERYMIAVTYAELTELNEASAQMAKTDDRHSHRGRFLSHSQMHLPQQHANVEKAPAIQFGPTHILWKVFNFVTSGW